MPSLMRLLGRGGGRERGEGGREREGEIGRGDNNVERGIINYATNLVSMFTGRFLNLGSEGTS